MKKEWIQSSIPWSLGLKAAGGLLLFFFLPPFVYGGHGLINTFASIEWLPEPGRTPDSPLYFLDGWREGYRLFMASDRREKIRRALGIAREKLAELEAMAREEKKEAALIAAELYNDYIRLALRETEGMDSEREKLAEDFCQAMLEHQYILSNIYGDLPRKTRTLLPQVVQKSQEAYRKAKAWLSPKKQGAFFWKEDEVRWSLTLWMREESKEQQQDEP